MSVCGCVYISYCGYVWGQKIGKHLGLILQEVEILAVCSLLQGNLRVSSISSLHLSQLVGEKNPNLRQKPSGIKTETCTQKTH